jgi:monoamine oxidase
MHITESDAMIEHSASANSLNHIPMLQNGHSPHVCIVGAGISGLKCAEHLILHGIKVTIIEARDRIGGRVGHAYTPISRYHSAHSASDPSKR